MGVMCPPLPRRQRALLSNELWRKRQRKKIQPVLPKSGGHYHRKGGKCILFACDQSVNTNTLKNTLKNYEK